MSMAAARRWSRAAAALAFALALGSLPAAAESYPSRPIRLVVPYAAGGTNDILARLVGAKLQVAWGQPVVVENRTGAGGNVGAEQVAKAPPDGYTLLVTASPPLSINASLYRALPFKPATDFAPISLMIEVPNLLEANPKLPVHSVAELVAYAKAHPAKLNFASQGSGTTSHLAGELLKLKTGIDVAHVPYRGTAPALNDLVAGNVDFMFDNLVSSLPLIRAGTLRALAVGSKARSPALPEVPTLIESGFPDFESTAWFAMVAPAGTPPAIVGQLSAGVAAALHEPEVAARMRDLGATTVGSDPAALGTLIKAEIARWAPVVEAAHITID
jgi:tripartite-type tricarboxylate transporter receptor subunit TctC